MLQQKHYESFLRATTKNTAIKLSSLVLTIGALHYLIKRVYYQMHIWLDNKQIRPTDSGWIIYEDYLQPVESNCSAALKESLKMIFCNCKAGSGVACSCRKVGLFTM